MAKDGRAQRAFELAQQYEQAYGGCAQCTLAALMEVLPAWKNPAVFQSATGLAAGIAQSGNACGGFTGGVMFISSVYGRALDNIADPEGKKFVTQSLCRKLLAKFEETYGSCNCAKIQEKNLGRSYAMYDPAERDRFNADGGHAPENCPAVCGNAAAWVIEILEEEGLI